MTTYREILQDYLDELEHRIDDLFIGALGESAIAETTRTVRHNSPYRYQWTLLFVPATLHPGTK